MLISKCALIFILSTSVLAANTVCACGALDDQGASDQHHAHTSHAAELMLSCTNIDCDGCDLGAVPSDRDQLKPQKHDEGLVFTIPAAFSSNTYHLADRNDRSYGDPPVIYDTPALRYDVILQ